MHERRQPGSRASGIVFLFFAAQHTWTGFACVGRENSTVNPNAWFVALGQLWFNACQQGSLGPAGICGVRTSHQFFVRIWYSAWPDRAAPPPRGHCFGEWREAFFPAKTIGNIEFAPTDCSSQLVVNVCARLVGNKPGRLTERVFALE